MGYFWAVPGFFTDKLGALYMFFTVRPNFSSIYGINAGNMGVFYWYFTFYRYFTGYFRDCFPSGVPKILVFFHSDFSLVCCEYLLILLRGSHHIVSIFACTEEIKTTLPPVGEYSDEECLSTMFSGELG